MKLYTVGQIAKRYKVPLSGVYHWRKKVCEVYGGINGVEKIKNDPYGRWGIPENIVDAFPNLPIVKK